MRWVLLLLLAGCGWGEADDDDATPDEVVDDDDSTEAGPFCTTWGEPAPVLEIDADWLDEISGLSVSARQPILWVIEDSGNEPEVVAIDFEGEVRARLTLDGTANRDWEDLALGPCGELTCLFVADVGDNANSALEVALLRLEEPVLDLSVDLLEEPVAFERLAFTYPGGPRDAEALVVDAEGTPWVFSKRGGDFSDVYRLVGLDPAAPVVAEHVREIRIVDEVVSLGVTAADLSPDGAKLLLRGYFDVREYELSDGVGSADFASSAPVPFGPEAQGEAIAYDAANRRILHVSEAASGSPPVYGVPCAD